MKQNKGFDYKFIGKAGGYGYDKLSQAVWQCFKNSGIEAKKVSPGNGQSREEFEAWGYVVCQVV